MSISGSCEENFYLDVCKYLMSMMQFILISFVRSSSVYPTIDPEQPLFKHRSVSSTYPGQSTDNRDAPKYNCNAPEYNRAAPVTLFLFCPLKGMFYPQRSTWWPTWRWQKTRLLTRFSPTNIFIIVQSSSLLNKCHGFHSADCEVCERKLISNCLLKGWVYFNVKLILVFC